MVVQDEEAAAVHNVRAAEQEDVEQGGAVVLVGQGGATGQDGICQNLQNIISDQEITNKGWEQLLQSGCRNSREFAAAWQTLQTEALFCFRYLQSEPKEVAAAGELGSPETPMVDTKRLENLDNLCNCIQSSNQVGGGELGRLL